MKIYTNTFDLRQPSEKKFWVAPQSDFKIGINVLGYNGTEMTYPPSNIELYKDGIKLTVDSNDGNMAYWKIKSEGTGEVTYTVKAKRNNNKVVGELKLIQVVTDSTVFEQESGSEIPSNLTDITSITVGNGPYSAITNNKVKTETVEATDIVVNNNSAFINGCGYIKGGALRIDDIYMDDHTIVVQGDNGAKLRLAGGCGSTGYLEIFSQNKTITIQPNPSVNNSELEFKPYFMQELNGGCGGYVLAAFL